MYSDKIWAWALTAVISYLLGSFSGSITVSRTFYKDDIRNFGSGNAGTTNVLRTYGKSKAALTLVIDFVKTIAAILIGKYLIGDFAVAVAGACAMLGHAFPLYYGFKGGKAAVCSSACMLMMGWKIFLIEAIIFFGSAFIKKTVSISTLLAAVTLPFTTWFFYRGVLDTPVGKSYMIFAVFIFLFVTYLHRSNIKRLLNGTENTLSGKGK